MVGWLQSKSKGKEDIRILNDGFGFQPKSMTVFSKSIEILINIDNGVCEVLIGEKITVVVVPYGFGN